MPHRQRVKCTLSRVCERDTYDVMPDTCPQPALLRCLSLENFERSTC